MPSWLFLNNLGRMIEAIIVVDIVIITETPNKSVPIIPFDKPMPAIINAISPRGIIPTPIRRAPIRLNPEKKAGIPLPIN